MRIDLRRPRSSALRALERPGPAGLRRSLYSRPNYVARTRRQALIRNAARPIWCDKRSALLSSPLRPSQWLLHLSRSLRDSLTVQSLFFLAVRSSTGRQRNMNQSIGIT